MANEIMTSLFGVTPEAIIADRQKQDYARAVQMAQLDPIQQAQAGFYMAGSQLGRGLGGLLGAEDPELMRVRQRQSLLQGVDPNDPEALKTAALKAREFGDIPAALQLAQQAQVMQEQAVKTRRVQNVLAQEEGFRAALSKLGPEATDEQIRREVLRFGDADKILSVLSASADKESARQARLMEAQARIDAQIQMARERNASQQQIAQMQLEGRMQIAQLAAALKADKGTDVDDKAATRIGQNVIFDKLNTDGENIIAQIDKNKEAFTPTGRATTALKSVFSPESKDVQARSDVDAYLRKARNAYLLSAKGTQTEGDATRAWEEFAGTLDFSSAEGAKRSVNRIRTELQTQKQANEAYLKSRKVPVPAGGPALGTRENPIKLQ